jgi:CheY-specific phosphatase CheX
VSNLALLDDSPAFREAGAKFDRDGRAPYTRAVESWILEAFLEAVRQVLRETGVSIDSEDPGEPPGSPDGIIASVGFTGDLRGVFTLHADLSSAGGLLRAMTGSLAIAMDDLRADEMRMEAFGELTNQISGRAMTLFYERKVRCDITPPAIFSGREIRSPAFGPGKSTSLILLGPFGRLALFLGVQEQKSADHLEKTS